jgi:LPS-assembly lipoprotein
MLASCQVTPLYSERAANGAAAALTSDIGIDVIDERIGQDVRNNLIFLLSGGRGEPASPRYQMNLAVTKNVIGILRDAADGRPRGRNLTLTAQYRIVEIGTDREVAVRTQTSTALFDDFDQAFAVIRAERDAEQRAARELAERIRADLALVMNKEPALGPAQGS